MSQTNKFNNFSRDTFITNAVNKQNVVHMLNVIDFV